MRSVKIGKRSEVIDIECVIIVAIYIMYYEGMGDIFARRIHDMKPMANKKHGTAAREWQVQAKIQQLVERKNAQKRRIVDQVHIHTRTARALMPRHARCTRVFPRCTFATARSVILVMALFSARSYALASRDTELKRAQPCRTRQDR